MFPSSTLLKLFPFNPKYQKYKNKVIPVFETVGIKGVLKLYLDARSELNNEEDHFLISILNVKHGMPNEALFYLEKACAEKDKDIARMIRKP